MNIWGNNFKNVDIPMNDILNIISSCQTGKLLVNLCQDCSFVFDSQIINYQYYPNENVISINPYGTIENKMVRLIKAMVRYKQYHNGILINPAMFIPEQAILFNRMLYADQQVMLGHVAWEINLLGDDLLWDYITKISSTLFSNFHFRVQNNFRSLLIGKADQIIFDAFFNYKNTTNVDKIAINSMLTYSKELDFNNSMNRFLTLDILMKFGDMFGRYNYLKDISKYLIDEYALIDDKSNCNLIWFIEFERELFTKEKIKKHKETINNIIQLKEYMK